MKTLLIILVALVALPLLAGVQQISMRANDWRVTDGLKTHRSIAQLRFARILISQKERTSQ